MECQHSEQSLKRLTRSASSISLTSLTISIVPSESSEPIEAVYGYKFGSVECCNDHGTIPGHRKHHHSTHGVVIRDEYYSGPFLRVFGKKKQKKKPLLFTLLSPDTSSPGTASANDKKITFPGEKPVFQVSAGSSSYYSNHTFRSVSENLEQRSISLEQAMLSTRILLERACKSIFSCSQAGSGNRRVASFFDIQPSPPPTPPNEEEKKEKPLEAATGSSPNATLDNSDVKDQLTLGLGNPIADVGDMELLTHANLRLMRGLQRKFDTLQQLQGKMNEDSRRLEKLLEDAEVSKRQPILAPTQQASLHQRRTTGFSLPFPQGWKAANSGFQDMANDKVESARGTLDLSKGSPQRHKRRSTIAVLPFFKSSSFPGDEKAKRRFSASSLVGRAKNTPASAEPPDALDKATMHLPRLERYPCISRY